MIRYRRVGSFVTHYVVVYDVCSPLRGRLLRRLLQGFLWQQQASVFEGELTVAQFRELCERIRSVINNREDSVMVYPLFKKNMLHKVVFGKVKYPIKTIF